MAAIESTTSPSPAERTAVSTPLPEDTEEFTVSYTQTLAFSSPIERLGAAPAATTSTGDVLVKALTSALTALEKAITKLTEMIGKVVELIKKQAEEKPAETKPAETKPADTKPADPKPADTGPLTPGTLAFAEKSKTELKADEDGRVSETEVRRNVVVYQLYQKDTKIADKFEDFYEAAQKEGDTPTEALRQALSKLVEEKKLEKWEANWVFSLSHRAAQFEGSQTALSTSSKSPAGMEKNAAIKLAEATLAGIQSNKIEVKPLTI